MFRLTDRALVSMTVVLAKLEVKCLLEHRHRCFYTRFCPSKCCGIGLQRPEQKEKNKVRQHIFIAISRIPESSAVRQWSKKKIKTIDHTLASADHIDVVNPPADRAITLFSTLWKALQSHSKFIHCAEKAHCFSC